MEKIFISMASILAIATVGGLIFFDQISFLSQQPIHLVKKISNTKKLIKIDPLPPIASSTTITIQSSTSTPLVDLVPPTSTSKTSGAIHVPIFVYHSVAPFYPHQRVADRIWTVTPEVFEQQLKYLRDHGYTTISFSDLNNYFASSTPLPSKPVILSFDDGWKNQYIQAFPLLKKYGFRGIFFVFSNAIGHKNYFSWDELKEVQNAGMIIGDHTMYHPYLFKISDEEILKKEIILSKKILEKKLGREITDFSYPFGHVSNKSLEIVKSAGYKTARTNGYAGSWYSKEDLFTLRSFNAQNDLAKFIAELN